MEYYSLSPSTSLLANLFPIILSYSFLTVSHSLGNLSISLFKSSCSGKLSRKPFILFKIIPTELLYSILAAREGVPFPIIFEILIMEISFQEMQTFSQEEILIK